jgi:hypothetical protein
MGDWKLRPALSRVALPLGIGGVALLALSRGLVAKVSEIDAFQRAVSSQSESDALAFVRDFGSRHLVPDLIELLQPDVALEVCASLSGASSKATAACDKLRSAVAIAPAAGPLTQTIRPAPDIPTTASLVAAPAGSPIVHVEDQQQIVTIPPVVPEAASSTAAIEEATGAINEYPESGTHDPSTAGGSTGRNGASSGGASGGSSGGSSSGSSGAGGSSSGSSGGSSGGSSDGSSSGSSGGGASSSGSSGGSSGGSSDGSSSGSSGGGGSSSGSSGGTSGGSSSGSSGGDDGASDSDQDNGHGNDPDHNDDSNPGHGHGRHGDGNGNSHHGDGN